MSIVGNTLAGEKHSDVNGLTPAIGYPFQSLIILHSTGVCLVKPTYQKGRVGTTFSHFYTSFGLACASLGSQDISKMQLKLKST